MNLPFPFDTETKSEFSARWRTHKTVVATYPHLGAAQAALERAWVKAKETSLVSIKTSVDEMVLFGVL